MSLNCVFVVVVSLKRKLLSDFSESTMLYIIIVMLLGSQSLCIALQMMIMMMLNYIPFTCILQ